MPIAATGTTAQHCHDVLRAFRLDATKLRYKDWDDLMEYCRYSASPVGRQLLDLHGESRETWPASDALCSALQVLNHLQDCAEDYRNLDRVYLPLELLGEAGVEVGALTAPASSSGLRRVIDRLLDSTDRLIIKARELPGGSWVTRVDDPYRKQLRASRKFKDRMRGRDRPPETGPLPGALTARVIEFTVTVTADDGAARSTRYRLLTTLLDHRAAPAAELAAAYARRWAVETCFAELKARLRGPGRVLRSRTPDLALQEIWAYLAVYQAIRAVIARTAAGRRLDPARLSFTAALNDARASAGRRPADALASAEAALLAAPVPERPGRVRARAVREPGSAYPSANGQDPLPRHATYTVTINPAPAPPANHPSQPKPPKNQAEPPP